MGCCNILRISEGRASLTGSNNMSSLNPNVASPSHGIRQRATPGLQRPGAAQALVARDSIALEAVEYAPMHHGAQAYHATHAALQGTQIPAPATHRSWGVP